MSHKFNKVKKHGKEYLILNGTYYDCDPQMAQLLENLRQEQKRVRFHWGNSKTGEDWGDVYDVTGKIGRSTGEIKIPLLIQTSRSFGGIGILCDSIVKITETTKPKRVIYEHSKYHVKKR